MPAETVTVTHCSICGEKRLISDMSLFRGSCMGCFNKYMVLCVDCGILLMRPGIHHATTNALRSIGYHVSDARLSEGDMHCPDCYYARHESYSQWGPKPLNDSTVSYARIGSQRKFGVEIETSRCPRRRELRNISPFGCKSDPTVEGMEFDSPILYGDEGLTHIEKMLDFAYDNGWEVDSDCGCHTHYDMRDESDESLWRAFYAYRLTGPVWETCVSPERLGAGYSEPMNVSARTIRRNYENDDITFADFCEHRQRYDYINIQAYVDHKTFEVRLLEGTLDPVEICNWIKLHCRFIDKAKELSFPELRRRFANKTPQERFTALADLIDDRELVAWLARRAGRESDTFFMLPRAEAAEPAQSTTSQHALDHPVWG